MLLFGTCSFSVTFQVATVTYVSFWMKLDEIFLPLETELSDFGPGEGVDFGVILEDQDSALCHSQIQWNPFVILDETEKKLEMLPCQRIASVFFMTTSSESKYSKYFR